MIQSHQFSAIKFIIPLFLVMNSLGGFSQDEKSFEKRIGIETGGYYFLNNSPEYDFIRGDIAHYDYYDPNSGSNKMTSDFSNSLIGMYLKLNPRESRLEYYGGVRLNFISSIYGKDIFNDKSKDFFYLLHSQNGTTTEYYKLNKISSNAVFLGVPIGVGFNIYRDRNWKIYAKTTASAYFKLSDQKNVNFFNPNMNIYEQDVLDKFGQHDRFFSQMSILGGFSYSIKEKVFINIDIIPISFLFSSFSTGIVESNYSTGMQLGFEVKL